MDAERRIKRARSQLLLTRPFWGHLSLRLLLTHADEVGTMGVDGRRLYYNDDFVGSLSDQELQFVVAHEVGHAMLMHMWRRQTREPLRWNLACDAAINHLLVKDNLTALASAYMPPEFDHMAAEAIYPLIKVTYVKRGGKGGQGQGEPQLPGQTIDNHEVWVIEDDGEEDGEEGKDGKAGVKQFQRHDTPASESEWHANVAAAATQARMQGKLPAHLAELVDEVLEPTVDWREYLRDVLVSSNRADYRLFPPNRRYIWQGIYLPSIQGSHVEVACIIDTSGSVSHDDMVRFVSEVRGIAQQFSSYKVWLITCDAAVHQFLTIENDADWPEEYAGRGGTDFRPPFISLADRAIVPPLAVYLTDGHGSYPEDDPGYPVLWLLNNKPGEKYAQKFCPWAMTAVLEGSD